MQYHNIPNVNGHQYRLYDTIAHLVSVTGYNGLVFRAARKTARVCGKPLLNVGCKRSYTERSDVNLDLVPRNVPHFVRGDIQNLDMFTDKQFGAVYASHVLEHVEDPDTALLEMHRVAEHVFVITPLPIFPWAWFHPDHRWILWHTRKVCRVPNGLRAAMQRMRRGLLRLLPHRIRKLVS
jgi:SAM-dependent methyltransferase